MPNPDNQPADRAVETALRRIRPAPAPAAFRRRLLQAGPPAPCLAQRSAGRFGWLAAAGIAAAGALGFFLLQPTSRVPQMDALSALSQSLPGLKPTAPSVPDQTPAAPAAAREVALLRRGLLPPVQVLEVEEVSLPPAGGSLHPDSARETSTRLISVVLNYY
ncbi:MAG: hypothetical protein KA004_06200 [Verrucomicrobiales bacterium]|nr:hypothetical protein [Verrucomicrobiales bacterium]